MAATTLQDALASDLTHLTDTGVIVGHVRQSTGNKLVWRIKTHDRELALDTNGAGAFVAGVRLGRRSARTALRPNHLRDAIDNDGVIHLALDKPNDPDAVKRQRNALFSAAYGLGLKGRFTVRREGDVLIGEVRK